MHKNITALAVIYSCFFSMSAFAGDRLLATGGVTQTEGAAGGGLTPWALIAGYATDRQVGASAYYSAFNTNGGFDMRSSGVSLGFYNRLEVALSQQKLGLSDTVPGATIKLNTLGIKLRLIGDAVYDQDRWLPQIAVGLQFKHNEDFSFVPQALGASKASGVDVYIAATKLYMAAIAGRNLLLNVTLRATKANQFGLLGFGGDQHDRYFLQPAGSAALMLSDQVLVGVEYRAKPDNLKIYKEDDAKDVFVTWFPQKNFSITAAYLDLGNIANKDNQSAWYLSGQVSY
jgi:hypothetical protein